MQGPGRPTPAPLVTAELPALWPLGHLLCPYRTQGSEPSKPEWGSGTCGRTGSLALVLPPCGPRKLPLVGVAPPASTSLPIFSHTPCPQGTSIISLKILVMFKAANRWPAGKFCLK